MRKVFGFRTTIASARSPDFGYLTRRSRRPDSYARRRIRATAAAWQPSNQWYDDQRAAGGRGGRRTGATGPDAAELDTIRAGINALLKPHLQQAPGKDRVVLSVIALPDD